MRPYHIWGISTVFVILGTGFTVHQYPLAQIIIVSISGIGFIPAFICNRVLVRREAEIESLR